jgi:hypothetical protein
VCIKCAGLHRSFGVSVSFIRSLTIDSWDDNQLQYLNKGGNKRFREFLNEFQVPKNATMDFKYMIRASEYYRKLLKSEVYGDEPPYKPDIIAGLEMLELINGNSDFSNLTPISNTGKLNKENTSFFGKMGNFFSKATDTVKSTAIDLGKKFQDLEIGDKLKSTGDKALGVVKTTGSFVLEKGKEVYVRNIYLYLAFRLCSKSNHKDRRRH